MIENFEGFSANPYCCPGGVPTIGYGATHYGDGRRVKLSDPPIANAAADALLKMQLRGYESGLERYLVQELNQNQFDALVSFAYNMGLGNLKRSTLMRKVNRNPTDPQISDAFKRWIFADGKLLEGLEKRRAREAELYFTPCA
ncbi:MAG: lysozyme [Flavobacteriales bacterium]